MDERVKKDMTLAQLKNLATQHERVFGDTRDLRVQSYEVLPGRGRVVVYIDADNEKGPSYQRLLLSETHSNYFVMGIFFSEKPYLPWGEGRMKP